MRAQISSKTTGAHLGGVAADAAHHVAEHPESEEAEQESLKHQDAEEHEVRPYARSAGGRPSRLHIGIENIVVRIGIGLCIKWQLFSPPCKLNDKYCEPHSVLLHAASCPVHATTPVGAAAAWRLGTQGTWSPAIESPTHTDVMSSACNSVIGRSSRRGA